jgi:hypothetical protein
MVFGDRAGLSPAEVASLTHGSPDDPCWTTDREAVLIRIADALHDASDVDDDLWRSARELLDERQLLDVSLLCGWYHAICFAARTARVDLEPGAPRHAVGWLGRPDDAATHTKVGAVRGGEGLRRFGRVCPFSPP